MPPGHAAATRIVSGVRSLGDRALRHPRWAVAAISVLAAAAALLAAGLHVPPTQDMLVRPHSAVGRATSDLERSFGSEPIVVALTGGLATTTLTPQNTVRLRDLERGLARLDGVQSVYGPGTFLAGTVEQFARILADTLGEPGRRAEAAAKQARALARRRGLSAKQAEAVGEQARLAALGPLQDEFSALVVRFGTIGLPSITNRDFVLTTVLNPAGTGPKAKFRQIFPDADHAVIAVRLRPGIDDDAVRRLGDRIAAQVRRAGLDGVRADVGGSPLLTASVGHDLRTELLRVAPVVLVAMALALGLALGAGLQIAALLALGLLATVLTAAACRLLGVGLSPGTLAALPIVFGLALDYAVQTLARTRRLAADGAARTEAVTEALAQIGPALRLAGAAMAVGFLTFLASSAPLLRDLGATLVIGTAVSLLLVLTAGSPLLALVDRPRARRLRLPRPPALPGPPGPRAARALTAVAGGLVLAGLVLGAGLTVQSDPTKLGRGDSAELRGVQRLQRELGTAGELRVRIAAPNVTRVGVLRWISDVEDRIVRENPILRRGSDPTQLLVDGGAESPDQDDVNRLLRLLPPALLRGVFSADRRTAEISFGLPLIPVERQRRIVQRVDRALRTAPAGVDAHTAGLVAAASSSVGSLRTAREILFPLAVLAVGLLLLAVRRRWERALVPLVPALVTAGLSGLLLAVLGVEPSALTVALEPLVLAVGVEFGVLLESGYQQARRTGHAPQEAVAVARDRVGRAVATSAAAVAVGFAGLAVSRLHVLSQFGLLAMLEIIICATAAVTMVPALAARCERAPAHAPAPRRPPIAETPHAAR